MSQIHIILTGGTIEKAYDPLTEKPEFRHRSILPEYLDTIVKIYPQVKFERICLIESFEMNDDMRANITKAVQASDSEKMVIVHGTSTMEDTARYLSQNLEGNNKSIVITGAMIPLKEFAMSDGGFNLGFAIAQVQHAQAGVYIAMNAHLFKAGEVVKDTSIGRFVSQ